MFLAFFNVILGYIVSKEGKVLDLEKIAAIVNMPKLKHYYILCLFAKGQTKNLQGLRSKNKKPEGFVKQN
jgi:hypothetical protein